MQLIKHKVKEVKLIELGFILNKLDIYKLGFTIEKKTFIKVVQTIVL